MRVGSSGLRPNGTKEKNREPKVSLSLSVFSSGQQGHLLRRRVPAVGGGWSDAKVRFFTRFKDRLKAEPSGLESRKKRTPNTPFTSPISATKQGLQRWGLRRSQMSGVGDRRTMVAVGMRMAAGQKT
ncbi:uncharacterized protein [Gossypium hirsutum]|uniref:Uncharacterized protein n=1 Tax=Gossypium hirsutum TaxID=3635 RepID=A0ABM2ZUC4_GOSHI|nr:uncharacterized protein LOC121215420 [Gossypium hirsutum]